MAKVTFDIGPGDRVKRVAGVGTPGPFVVDSVMANREGKKLVLLEGQHIGWNGGQPYEDFEIAGTASASRQSA